MQALDPCDHFHWLVNSNSSLETDFSPLFSPLLAAQDVQDSQASSLFSGFSGSSTVFGSTPRKLRDWPPVDWSFDSKLDPKRDPKLDSKLDSRASSLCWRPLEVSPPVQGFLPAKIIPGSLNPALLTECKETEDVIEEVQSSAFDTLDSRNSSFDMSTFSSTLSLSYPTKVHSRSQSRFHSLFQSMKSDMNSDINMNSDMNMNMNMNSDMNSESKSPPKGNLVTQRTMDFLFGGCIPCDAETIGETIGNIGAILEEPIWENAETIWENGETIWENTETFWENGETFWEMEKPFGKMENPFGKMENPFEDTDSIPTPVWVLWTPN